MSEKRYRGKEIDVTFDLRRCIHAAECGKRLQVVFDTSKRPWAQPDNASAAEVADTINHCPSGALKYERHDGGPAEAAPDVNTILITDSGEYQIHGDVTVTTLDGEEIASEYRLTLCRCGESANKPFCDNSHKKARFTAPSFVRDNSTVTENHPSGGPLKIVATKDGPLLLQGRFEIRDEAGKSRFRGEKTALCRCGASANKPFCDGTHQSVGFTSD